MKRATRFRSVVTEVLRALPVSSEVFGPVKGFAATVPEWLACGSSAARRSEVREILPAFAGERQLPVTCDGAVPWTFHAYFGGMKIDDPAAWVLRIPGGRVVGNGAVITPDDRLLGDVSREFIVGGDQQRHSVLKRARLPRLERLSGTAAVLAVVDTNYWHWFFDLLPRILLLQADPSLWSRIDHFIVNPLRARYQHETLAMLGVPSEKVVETRGGGTHFKAGELLVPSVFTEVPARWACEQLRQRFTQFMPPQTGGRHHLFLSRADARTRRVLNEDAVFAELAPMGFEKIVMGGRSVADQRSLFSSADIIVAPHGAGLTNLLFCRPGTAVVEIFPPTYINPCYWVLSDHLGLRYHACWGEGSIPPAPPLGHSADEWFWSFVTRDENSSQHMVVDIQRLAALTRDALSQTGSDTSPIPVTR
jgi:capsular polysaccharide biosynthesis protein